MITTKSCGSCGQQVPISTEVGQRCPYCHVRFGYSRERGSGGHFGIDWSKLVWIILAIGLVIALILPQLASKHHTAPQTTSSPEPVK